MSPRILAASFALLAAATLVPGCSGRSAREAASPSARPVPGADARHGQAVYQAQCQACHGAGGTGGPVGGSLQNESARRTYHQVYAIVRDPAPPMPKLYPGSMSLDDVRDVSAYVESL